MIKDLLGFDVVISEHPTVQANPQQRHVLTAVGISVRANQHEVPNQHHSVGQGFRSPADSNPTSHRHDHGSNSVTRALGIRDPPSAWW